MNVDYSVLMDDFKRKITARIDDSRHSLEALSRKLHANPETAFQEHQAAAWLCEELKRGGFSVARGIAGLPTAFVGSLSSGRPGPCIGLIAEYDALPEVGHGCGHNLIAAGAIGAALGLSTVAFDLPGCIKVFGTPAEEYTEGRAGKLPMLEAGVFEGVDAFLFFHPYTFTSAPKKDLGFAILEAVFSGRPAHAAADPWNGLNALDGVFVAYSGLSALRQQLPPDARLHVIVTEGGQAVNIIPHRASLRTMFRSPDRGHLEELQGRVKDVLAGAALASRTEQEARLVTKVYNTKFNRILYEVAERNMKALGAELGIQEFLPISGDFGNLSQAAPGFYFTVKTHRAGINWHSADVAREAVSDAAHDAMILAAKVLAMTTIDLLTSPGLTTEVAECFREEI
jgi:amidohydrolase